MYILITSILGIIYAIFLNVMRDLHLYKCKKKKKKKLSEVKGPCSSAQEFFLVRFLPVTVNYGFNIVLTQRPIVHYLISQHFSVLNYVNLTINAQPITHNSKTIEKRLGTDFL